MRLVTLNVRNPSFPDGEHAWPHRRDEFFETLRRLDPDVLCLQETHARHLAEILDGLPGRHAFGVPREEGEYAEMCAVIVRDWMAADRSDTEWLCETGRGLGWDAKCPRVVTWVDLGPFAVLNAHLDHVGLEARRNGMAQALRRADALGKPCLIVGDLNATPEEPPLELTHAAGFVDLAEETGPTFHGFSKWAKKLTELSRGLERIRELAQEEPDKERRAALRAGADEIDDRHKQYEALLAGSSVELTRIDYVLARGPWACRRAWVERGEYSDHWAVAVDLELDVA